MDESITTSDDLVVEQLIELNDKFDLILELVSGSHDLLVSLNTYFYFFLLSVVSIFIIWIIKKIIDPLLR